MLKTLLLIFCVTAAAYGMVDLIARLLYRILFCGGSVSPIVVFTNDPADEFFPVQIAAWRFFGADGRCKPILVSEDRPNEAVCRACRRYGVLYCSEEQLQKTIHTGLKKR